MAKIHSGDRKRRSGRRFSRHCPSEPRLTREVARRHYRFERIGNGCRVSQSQKTRLIPARRIEDACVAVPVCRIARRPPGHYGYVVRRIRHLVTCRVEQAVADNRSTQAQAALSPTEVGLLEVRNTALKIVDGDQVPVLEETERRAVSLIGSTMGYRAHDVAGAARIFCIVWIEENAEFLQPVDWEYRADLRRAHDVAAVEVLHLDAIEIEIESPLITQCAGSRNG